MSEYEGKRIGLSKRVYSFNTLVYLIAEQAVISEQDGIFQKIVKRAGHNKQAGWNIFENLISQQAEFHRKKKHF